MASLGPIDLLILLVAVAAVAAMCGFIASTRARRNKRRARRIFLFGFVFGLTAGAMLRGRRRGLNRLRAVARSADRFTVHGLPRPSLGASRARAANALIPRLTVGAPTSLAVLRRPL